MDAYIGEIRIFAGNYAPENWALCNGASLSVHQYQPLYTIIGTKYGSDGPNTFKLPNLLGRAPMHWGSADGLTTRNVGEQVGENVVTLNISQLPAHTHMVKGSSMSVGGVSSPENAVWGAESGVGSKKPYRLLNPTTKVAMSNSTLQNVGEGQAHNNMQPNLSMNYIICLNDGDYPIKP